MIGACSLRSIVEVTTPSATQEGPGTGKLWIDMLGGWVNPHWEQQIIPQGQTSIPPESFSTPTANGQSAPWPGSARGVGRGAGSHTPSTASESFSQKETDGKVCIHSKGFALTWYRVFTCDPSWRQRRRSWLQDTLKRKLVDFAWNRRFFLFIWRVLAFFRVNPAKSFDQPDFFYPERLVWSIIGSISGEPGETGRGGARKKSKNQRVFFSRYLAANDVRNLRGTRENLSVWHEVHIHTHTHTRTHTHTYIYIQIYTDSYIYIYIYTYVYVYIYVYIYIYISG